MTTPPAPLSGEPDPYGRALARELDLAVRSAAAQAVANAMEDVKDAIAAMTPPEAGERDALAAAAMDLPETFAPLVESVIRQALRDEREALAGATERGFSAAAAKFEAAVKQAREQAQADARAGDMGQALLDRVFEEWRAAFPEILATVLVPQAGTLTDIATQVASVDERLGDLETLMRLQSDAIATLGRKLDHAAPASAAPPSASLPFTSGGAIDAEALASAIEARLGPTIAKELSEALAPLAAEQRAVAEQTESRANAADLAIKAMRSHIKAATRAEKEHAERLIGMSRHVEGIAGRLAFAVEALSGHASLIDRLQGAVRWQNVFAVGNFVAALLIFVAVFLDRFWYLLR